MTLRATAEGLAAAFQQDRAKELVGRLSALDRFPASSDLNAAAELVADQAERAGLQDVRVERWEVDGERQRWWSFDAPASWTPRSAWLRWRWWRPAATPG